LGRVEIAYLDHVELGPILEHHAMTIGVDVAGDEDLFDRAVGSVEVEAVDVVRDAMFETETTGNGETTDQDKLALALVPETTHERDEPRHG